MGDDGVIIWFVRGRGGVGLRSYEEMKKCDIDWIDMAVAYTNCLREVLD